jgi:hypothetical protein
MPWLNVIAALTFGRQHERTRGELKFRRRSQPRSQNQWCAARLVVGRLVSMDWFLRGLFVPCKRCLQLPCRF